MQIHTTVAFIVRYQAPLDVKSQEGDSTCIWLLLAI